MVKTKCVHCGFLVHEFTTECPSCGKPVANKYAPTNVSNPPWNWHAESKRSNPAIPVMIIVTVIAIAGVVIFSVLG